MAEPSPAGAQARPEELSSTISRLVAAGPSPQRSVPARVVLEHAPDNDDFEDAVAVPSVPFTAKTTSSGATRQAAEPASCAAVRGGTIWYRYTPPEDERLVATTAGTGFATTLAVFTGTDMRVLSEVGCDAHPTSNTMVPFVALRSQSYWFQVGAAAAGTVVFSLDPQPTTTRVSVASDGTQANHRSWQLLLSDDGRFVGFVSHATNLAPGFRQWRAAQQVFCPLEQQEPFHTVAQNYDTVSCQGLTYVHDRTGRSLVMVDLSGVDPACGDVVPEVISGDGAKILFNRMRLRQRWWIRIITASGCSSRPAPHPDSRLLSVAM